MNSSKLIILIVLVIHFTDQVEYPKNINLTKGKKFDLPRSVTIESANVLHTYITKSEYAIAVFHMNWCGHCKQFIPIFDKASSYHLTEQFSFLKINCDHKDICKAYDVDRFPTIKVYHKGKELKAEPVHELEAFLEFIDKLISNPIVKVTNINTFYSEYGTFSPLILYDKTKPEFASCITYLAKGDYSSRYYFGIMPIKEPKEKEKLVFDFDNNSISYEWKNNCAEMKNHLDENIFPLMKKINSSVIKKIQMSSRLAIFLFINATDNHHIEFINIHFTQISKSNRKIVFGYVDINTDHELTAQLKIQYNNNPKLLVYNFKDYKYFIEPQEFEMDKVTECYHTINSIVHKINTLQYTTGSKLGDFLMMFGLKANSTTYVFLFLGVLILVIILILFVIIIWDKTNTPIEEYNKKQQ